jgi:Zn-dependent peptidase ImmA (M78 family)/transcriptional regulator with XRE-family HTH domain
MTLNRKLTPVPNPRKIKEARIARGLTMSELAEQIGVTRQAISQYEKGDAQPSALTLIKMMQVLRFPLTFFVDYDETPATTEGTIFFRSLQSKTQRARNALEVKSDWIWRIFNYLGQFVDFPPVNLPDIRIKRNHSGELDDDQIEEIAMRVRKEWGLGLGPISDVILLLEKNGFIVSQFRFGVDNMDAFSQWRGGRPFVYLSTDKGSAVRSRYNAAHELGHLLLHDDIDAADLTNKSVLKRVEDEAHRFAGAFLLPADTFASEVFSSSLDYFIELKRRWKVSIAAMITRCERLGLLPENRILYLRQQMSRRKMRTWEPLDDELIPESPRILRESIQLLLKSGVQSASDILDALKWWPEEIEELCSLDAGTLTYEGKVIPISLKQYADVSDDEKR